MNCAIFIFIVFHAALSEDVIRLVQPPDATYVGQGRVEVQHQGTWGTICDDEWSFEDATVVCEQMGFLKAIYQAKRAKFGQGTGPVWLSKMMCTGREKSLTDCPHQGWGENSCGHERDAGVSCLQEGLPQILEVGCYRDAQGDRALNNMYASLRGNIDWHNLRSLVTRCAERAFELGYRYFGVQFYGECWGDDRPRPTYDKHGAGKGCTDGVGDEIHNFVYRFATWRDLGCWRDTGDGRTMTMLENFRGQIDWFHLEKTVEKCYEAAKKKNKKYFAIQFYGECWVSDTESYKVHGPSTNCWNGVGRDYDNYVYEVLF
ncbi:neurotrypsin-like [Pocillopora damicornis]|uniref:neurotrypsin-like n=1 Tax=Pocillopora damicornis TaxID=46731 RepID=UPI000F55884D|nr:neurotrypsin-like [Pocillopora damicornis]